MKVDLERLLDKLWDTEDPSREWHERHFLGARAYALSLGYIGVEGFRKKWTAFAEASRESYTSGEISPASYARLLIVYRILHLDSEEDELIHMMAHLAELSFTEKDEKDWRAAAGKEGSTYKKPMLSGIVNLLLIDLAKWERTQLIKGLFEYAYFGYLPWHQRLLDESCSEDAWLRNLLDLVPFLALRHFFPLTVDGAPNAFIDNVELDRYQDEGKKLGELFANVFVALTHFGVGDVEDRLASFRRDFYEILRKKGRLEAKKHLIFTHRNRLWIPTYVYKELSAAS